MESSKMIIAVVAGEDSAETINELNKNGFYVTILSTTGGFLKRKSVTMLIGTEACNVQKVTAILRAKAGRRKEQVYYHAATFSERDTGHLVSSPSSIPIEQEVGGAVVFIMDLNKMEKY
ncbi:MAG TPA: cyclic-di-AMP receptor [Bacillota bacterium]|nr:cyclic-di-AMP receptor [Bacillota bacterium]